MSRSPQESTACKLPFKCCVFVVSPFIYLFTNFWFNQKPPLTCYTTSMVGLLQSFIIVLLLGLPRHKILPKKHLGPCITFLALLLHCSIAGANFIFIRNHLLQHPWTLDLLILYPAPLLWHITKIRGVIFTVRHTIALLVVVHPRLMLRITALLGTAHLLRILHIPRVFLAVAAHQLGLHWPHLFLCRERAVPSPCESHPLHMLRLIVVL